MLRSSKNSRQTIFQQHYSQGHIKLVDKKFDDALRDFEIAAKNFNQNQDELYRLVDMMLDSLRIFKSRKIFNKARQIIQNCQKNINDYLKTKNLGKEMQIQKLECKFKVLTQLAQIYADQIQNDTNSNLEQIMQKLDKCTDCNVNAIEIAASVLLKQTHYNLSMQQIQQWQASYAESVISSIDSLIIESSKYEGQQNLQTCKLIYKIAEKADKFSQLSHQSQKVMRVKARSWYYRGAMLLKTSNKNRQILHFLMQDYKYCFKNKLQVDLKKTKIQLVKYHNRLQNFQKVRQYLQKQHKQLFNKQQGADLEKVKNLQQKIKSTQFLNYNTQKQIQLIRELIQIIQNQQNKWWNRVPILTKMVLPRIDNTINNYQTKFQLCYQTATAYYQLFDQLNALDYCKQAEKLCCKDSDDYIQVFILQAKIYQRAGKYDKADDINKLLLNVCQNTQYYQTIKNKIKNKQFKLKRIQVLESKLLQSQIQKQLFQMLISKKAEQENINRVNSHNQNEEINKQNKYFARNQANNFMRNKSNKQILQQKYKNLCKQKNISLRKCILNQISKLTNQQFLIKFDLSLLFQIPSQQLQVYLEIIDNDAWDLRNHVIKQSFINKFVQKIQDRQIISLKLSNINRTIQKSVFERMMLSLRNISQLHLEKVDKKFISERVNSNILGLPFCGTIQILKLKECFLTDKSIESIGNSYPQLIQLDLSKNLLKGTTLSSFNKLKSLQKLNLSYNPIQTSNNLWNKSIKKLKLKGLTNTNIFSSLLFKQIKLVRILDLSQNKPQVLQKILDQFVAHAVQNQVEQLQTSQIRLKYCSLNLKIFEQLNQIVALARFFKKLDLRFSFYDKQTLQRWSQHQNQCQKYIEVDSRAHKG